MSFSNMLMHAKMIKSAQNKTIQRPVFRFISDLTPIDAEVNKKGRRKKNEEVKSSWFKYKENVPVVSMDQRFGSGFELKGYRNFPRDTAEVNWNQPFAVPTMNQRESDIRDKSNHSGRTKKIVNIVKHLKQLVEEEKIEQFTVDFRSFAAHSQQNIIDPLLPLYTDVFIHSLSADQLAKQIWSLGQCGLKCGVAYQNKRVAELNKESVLCYKLLDRFIECNMNADQFSFAVRGFYKMHIKFWQLQEDQKREFFFNLDAICGDFDARGVVNVLSFLVKAKVPWDSVPVPLQRSLLKGIVDNHEAILNSRSYSARVLFNLGQLGFNINSGGDEVSNMLYHIGQTMFENCKHEDVKDPLVLIDVVNAVKGLADGGVKFEKLHPDYLPTSLPLLIDQCIGNMEHYEAINVILSLGKIGFSWLDLPLSLRDQIEARAIKVFQSRNPPEQEVSSLIRGVGLMKMDWYEASKEFRFGAYKALESVYSNKVVTNAFDSNRNPTNPICDVLLRLSLTSVQWEDLPAAVQNVVIKQLSYATEMNHIHINNTVMGLATMGVKWGTMNPELKRHLMKHMSNQQFLVEAPFHFNITNTIKQLGIMEASWSQLPISCIEVVLEHVVRSECRVSQLLELLNGLVAMDATYTMVSQRTLHVIEWYIVGSRETLTPEELGAVMHDLVLFTIGSPIVVPRNVPSATRSEQEIVSNIYRHLLRTYKAMEKRGELCAVQNNTTQQFALFLELLSFSTSGRELLGDVFGTDLPVLSASQPQSTTDSEGNEELTEFQQLRKSTLDSLERSCDEATTEKDTYTLKRDFSPFMCNLLAVDGAVLRNNELIGVVELIDSKATHAAVMKAKQREERLRKEAEAKAAEEEANASKNKKMATKVHAVNYSTYSAAGTGVSDVQTESRETRRLEKLARYFYTQKLTSLPMHRIQSEMAESLGAQGIGKALLTWVKMKAPATKNTTSASKRDE